MPICISKPSAVRCSGIAITPALLIRMSRSPSQPVGERAHRGEVGEVEPAHLGRARRSSAAALLALRGVADGEHDARAGAAERAGGGEADAAVGAGDDDGPAVEVGEDPAAVHFEEVMPSM